MEGKRHSVNAGIKIAERVLGQSTDAKRAADSALILNAQGSAFVATLLGCGPDKDRNHVGFMVCC